MSLLKKTRKSITKTRASLGRLGAHNEKISFSLEGEGEFMDYIF